MTYPNDQKERWHESSTRPDSIWAWAAVAGAIVAAALVLIAMAWGM